MRQQTGNLITGTKRVEVQDVDLVFEDAAGNIIANVEVKTFRITDLSNSNNISTIGRLVSQLIRYIAIKKQQPASQFWYAVPDAETQNRILNALESKGDDILERFEDVFGDVLDVHFIATPSKFHP